MRKEFQLTEEQYQGLMAASRPVLAIALQAGMPASPQATANAWWKKLGEELGFDYMTARPSPRGARFFTAEVEEHTPDSDEPHPAAECETRGCVKLSAGA